MLINQLLSKRKQAGNFRFLKTTQGLIDFASNDYLGLASSKSFQKTVLKEWSSLNRLGSGGSRLLTGNSTYIEALEDQIANFHGFETGLIFNCGYMANVGLISSITEEKDTLLFDSHIHASMHEGIRLAKAKAFAFRHNDLEHLEKRLKMLFPKGHLYICIESIYSTDGTIAPLAQIFALAEKYQARLIVDEAHAVGVFGEKGEGLVYKNGLSGKIFAQVVTFGKALGAFGAIVLGDKRLKEVLVNFAKSFIYTTALPFSTLAAIKCSYETFPNLTKKRDHLHNLIHLCNSSCSPIQPIFVHDNNKACLLVKALKEEGFDVRALLSPTVQRGKENIRLTLHSFNSIQELSSLIKLVREYG